MRTPTIAAAWALFAAAAVQAVAAEPPQPYRMAPPSPWISIARDIPLETSAPVEEGESDYLLADHQLRLGAVTEHYVRFVERLLSQEDVDDGAQIAIDIDPEHERVLLHEVRVIRNGHSIDKLRDARRSLLNREENLDDGIIDGRVTLHVLLQDVRVGDVLDYSYTTERKDPFGERGFSDSFSTQWSSPVRRYRLRVLHRADRPLQVRDHSQLHKPAVTRQGDWIETTWGAKNLAALVGDSHRPPWFFLYPRIELSEFADWNAVRAWSAPLYTLDGTKDAALAALAADLGKEPDPAVRIVRALRFVQDDIRYTGLEIGAGAYRPTQPATVLARRYGDCKDKVFLLVTLLHRLGIEAWPALVSANDVRGVAERVSSPGAFDHAIAKVRWKNRDYWLDATVSGQGGGLDTLVQADFGLALVIDGSSGGLEKIPAREGAEPSELAVETFDLRKGKDQTATFRVKTVYREEEADSMRVKMRSNTATSVGKEYLDYYRKTYAGVRMTKPLVVRDDRARNVITVEETYDIDKPFRKNKKGDWKFELEAFLVTDRAADPEDTERTAPLAREFPMHVRHQIVVYLPDGWDIDEETVKISDPAFEYRSDVRYRNGRLQLDYDLRNTSDHVAAAAFKRFARNIGKVKDDGYFTLTDSTLSDGAPTGREHTTREKKTSVAAAAPPPTGPSLEVMVTTLAGLLTGVAAALGLLHVRRRLSAADPDAPSGISGWLVFPGCVTFLLPFVAVQALRFSLDGVLMAEQFARIGDVLQIWHLANLFALSLLLVPSLVAAWLMGRRMARYPWAFVATQLLFLLAIVVDAMLKLKSGEPLPTPASELLAHALMILVGLVGIIYVLASQRVRATFVNPRRAPASA